MSRVVVSDAFAEQLFALPPCAELVDGQGRAVGTFVRAGEKPISYKTGGKSPLSHEEKMRRLAEPGGSSLAEVWERIKKQAS